MHERRTPKKVRRARSVKELRPSYPDSRTHHKGDEHSGGGGNVRGGGKKRRPPGGWQKAAVVRDVDAEHDPFPLPIKPGRDPERKASVNAQRRARRKRRTP